MITLSIRIDGTTDLFQIIYQLQDPAHITAGSDVTLEIDYTCGTFVDGQIYPVLVSYYQGLKSKGVNVKATFDTSQICETVLYAGRMEFFSQLDIPYQYPLKKQDPHGRFIPISIIPIGQYTLDHEFGENLCERLGIDGPHKDAFLFAIGEIIANITLHSKADCGGIIYGQYFPNKKEIHLILVDPGRGIHQAFVDGSNKEAITWDEEVCLRKCMEKGITCGNGRGHGLFLVKEIINRNLGLIRIVSGTHYASVVNGNLSVRSCDFWQGCIVVLEFNLNNPVSLKDVYIENGYDPQTEVLW